MTIIAALIILVINDVLQHPLGISSLLFGQPVYAWGVRPGVLPCAVLDGGKAGSQLLGHFDLAYVAP